MCNPQTLTTPQASTTCHGDNFTSFSYFLVSRSLEISACLLIPFAKLHASLSLPLHEAEWLGWRNGCLAPRHRTPQSTHERGGLEGPRVYRKLWIRQKTVDPSGIWTWLSRSSSPYARRCTHWVMPGWPIRSTLRSVRILHSCKLKLTSSVV
jgi:hypothetical protein